MTDWPPLRDYAQSRAVVMGAWDYVFCLRLPLRSIACGGWLDCSLDHCAGGPWTGCWYWRMSLVPVICRTS